MTVLYMGLVCWLVTTIVVDGVIFRGARRGIRQWARVDGSATPWWLNATAASTTAAKGPLGVGEVFGPPRRLTWRDHVAYLVTYHLCAGVWVGAALAVLVPGPVSVRLVGWALNGLLYKAVGHLVLEVVGLAQRLPADSA